MSTSENKTLVIPVDSEHTALRLSMLGVIIALMVVSYIVLNLVIPAEGLNLIAIFGALAITYLGSQQIEQRLKNHWPSGRAVHVMDEQIQVVTKGEAAHTIDAQQQVNVLLWCFEIKRRARVPKGWYMVACALEQEGTYLPAYTLISPNQYKELSMAQRFTLLASKKDLEKQERDMRLAGQQRRLHMAEQARWMHGAEMSPSDFETYIAHLQVAFPKWMPTN